MVTETPSPVIARPEVDGKPTPREIVIWGFLVLFMLTLIGLSMWRRVAVTPEPPGVYGMVPAFSLVNRDGRAVSKADFAGVPWVADFMFTRCVGICPQLGGRMQRLVQTLDASGAVRFVSFSVEPEHDTPEVLEAYAARFDAPPHWYFLTGEHDAVYALVRRGFKLAVEPAPEAAVAVGEDILHSNRFVLVDGAGQIRGYYDAFDDAALAQLQADLSSL